MSICSACKDETDIRENDPIENSNSETYKVIDQVLEELNSKCLNKNTKGFSKWKRKHLIRDNWYGREGGKYNCIGILNKKTGVTESNICSSCDKIITEYRKFPFTQGVNVLELKDNFTDSIGTIANLQRQVEILQQQIMKLEQRLDAITGANMSDNDW